MMIEICLFVVFPSCRHVLAVMSFLGFVNVYALRVNLSVAIVAMVNSSYNAVKNGTMDVSCGNHSDNSSLHHTKVSIFHIVLPGGCVGVAEGDFGCWSQIAIALKMFVLKCVDSHGHLKKNAYPPVQDIFIAYQIP